MQLEERHTYVDNNLIPFVRFNWPMNEIGFNILSKKIHRQKKWGVFFLFL